MEKHEFAIVWQKSLLQNSGSIDFLSNFAKICHLPKIRTLLRIGICSKYQKSAKAPKSDQPEFYKRLKRQTI